MGSFVEYFRGLFHANGSDAHAFEQLIVGNRYAVINRREKSWLPCLFRILIFSAVLDLIWWLTVEQWQVLAGPNPEIVGTADRTGRYFPSQSSCHEATNAQPSPKYHIEQAKRTKVYRFLRLACRPRSFLGPNSFIQFSQADRPGLDSPIQ